MATKIQPPKKADVTALLRNLFLRTEQELIREITRKRAAGHVEYAEVAALERVQKILQNMVDTSWSYVPVMIEKIFYHSDKDAAGYTNARTITGTRSVTQIAIMEQLANNLQGELMEMAGTAKRSVENVFTIARLENDPYRKLALEQILRQEAAGKPWIKSSQDLVKELETNGITGFTDKAGRKWSMQAYGNMAVRTTARQAEVAALLTSDEYDLWQITKVGTTCPVCAPLEGRVYSKSGTNPDYPPLTVAFGKIDPYGSNDLSNTYLNIHPNCLHSLVKYTTIGKSAERIQTDKDFSSIEKNPLNRDPRTKKQIAAYREKEKNRQQLLRDGDIRKGRIPENRLHMIDRFELFAKVRHVFIRHILHDHKGKRAFAEIFEQFVLPDHSIHIRRKIVEHIVVDPCADHTKYRRDHEQYGEYQNGYAVFDHRF